LEALKAFPLSDDFHIPPMEKTLGSVDSCLFENVFELIVGEVISCGMREMMMKGKEPHHCTRRVWGDTKTRVRVSVRRDPTTSRLPAPAGGGGGGLGFILIPKKRIEKLSVRTPVRDDGETQLSPPMQTKLKK